MPTIQIIVRGKVQGVFYRMDAADKAIELNLKGWVRNNKDGTVELLISAGEAELEKFIEWAKAGPPGAIVEEVLVTPKGDMELDNFTILR